MEYAIYQDLRKRQENSYLAAVSQGDQKDIDEFCVFYGFDVKEISQFISNHFAQKLVINKILNINMSHALKETFL